MVAVITEADRKYLKRHVADQIDVWKDKKARIKDQIDNWDASKYNDSEQDKLQNKNATDYKADIDAQLIFIQAEIDRLQNIKQWLTELVI